MLDTRILSPVPFASLLGWDGDDHSMALDTFRSSARRMVEKAYTTRSMGVDGVALAVIAAGALGLTAPSPAEARDFFETHFSPYKINSTSGETGFVTGYFEPVVAASRLQSETFSVPLYSRPLDLIDVSDEQRPADMHVSFRFGRKTSRGITEYPDREDIQNGCLDGLDLELVWLRNKVDAFFIHVQGSAKLQLDDGSIMRVTYAAKSGHPYSSVAKVLCAERNIEPAEMTADRLAEWMHSNPDEIDALLAKNRSYIFFKEILGLNPDDGPIAAAKTALVAGRSLAVDRTLHTFGSPIWLNTVRPLPGETGPLSRLMIAQDTGSAIVGPARGDIFVGSGEAAGFTAGRIRHQANMVVLVPKTLPT